MSSSAFQDSARAATVAGALSITFPSVRPGYIVTGSVQIPDAVSASVIPVKFTAFDGSGGGSGIPIGSWYNDQASPDLQIQQQLSITASGLVTGTYRAFLQGMITPAAETQPYWPGPTPAPPTGSPQVLSITGGTVSPANTVVTIGSAAVIVGTSLAITASFADAAGQLELGWTTPALFASNIWNLLGYFSFDLAQSALCKGLVLPNLGPLLVVKAITAAASTGLSLTLFTGLPPITRPPMVAGGVLWYAVPPVGASTIAVPPYVGPVAVVMQPNNTAGFGVDVGCSDYTGTLIAVAKHEQGWPAGTGPFVSGGIIYLPPLINQVRVSNAPAGAIVSGIALGP